MSTKGIPNYNAELKAYYGVISGNSCEATGWIVDEITQSGTSLQYEEWAGEVKADIRSMLESATWLDGLDGKDLDDKVEAVFYALDLEAPEWEEEEYETGDMLLGYLGGAPLIWITKSDWVCRCNGCSPCVPNAGDLDSPLLHNGMEALCFDPETMQSIANETENDYILRNLKTNKTIHIEPKGKVEVGSPEFEKNHPDNEEE